MDTAHLNLYPVASQARDARWSATPLSGRVIPSTETHQGPLISAAEADSAKASINWLGDAWGCVASRFTGQLELLSTCLHFWQATEAVLQDRQHNRRSPFLAWLLLLCHVPNSPDGLNLLHWTHLNWGLVLMLVGKDKHRQSGVSTVQQADLCIQ